MAVSNEINALTDAVAQVDHSKIRFEANDAVPAGGGGAVSRFFVNRVWDSALGEFVSWASTAAPDTTGASYPHTWVNASDFTFVEVCH